MDSIEAFIKEIKNCKEGCYEKYGVKGTPLVGGSATSKILIVSQDPSQNAWDKGKLFESENATAKRLAEILGLQQIDFNEQNIFWIHIANCDTGKYPNGRDRRPNFYCAQKFIPKLLEIWEPKFILLVGGVALKFMCGKNYKIGKDIGKELTIWNKYTGVAIAHPSKGNLLLNNPDVIKKQLIAFKKVRKAVYGIFQNTSK